jgi:hypothetical protein
MGARYDLESVEGKFNHISKPCEIDLRQRDLTIRE